MGSMPEAGAGLGGAGGSRRRVPKVSTWALGKDAVGQGLRLAPCWLLDGVVVILQTPAAKLQVCPLVEYTCKSLSSWQPDTCLDDYQYD